MSTKTYSKHLCDLRIAKKLLAGPEGRLPDKRLLLLRHMNSLANALLDEGETAGLTSENPVFSSLLLIAFMSHGPMLEIAINEETCWGEQLEYISCAVVNATKGFEEAIEGAVK